jgi:hypothetical protein
MEPDMSEPGRCRKVVTAQSHTRDWEDVLVPSGEAVVVRCVKEAGHVGGCHFDGRTVAAPVLDPEK